MLRTSGAAYAALAAIVFIAIAPTARADGMVGSLKDGTARAPVEEYVWSGFYGGVGVGAGRLGYDVGVDASKTTKKTTWTTKKEKRKKKVCKTVTVNDCKKVCTPGGTHEECYDKVSFGKQSFGKGGKDCKTTRICKKKQDKPHCERKCWPKEVEKCIWTYEYVDGTPIETMHTTSKDASSHFSGDEWDVFGTVQIGYDRLVHQRFLIGAFADFDFYSGSSSSFSGSLGDLGSVDGSFGLNHVWSVGGRLGYLASPRLLLYGVAGYTQASVDGSVYVQLDGVPGLTLAMPDELHGYFVGGGGEFKLRRNLSLKLEYRWSDFGSVSASASGVDIGDKVDCVKNPTCAKCQEQTVANYSAHADFDAGIHSVRANLVYKFGEPERPPAVLK